MSIQTSFLTQVSIHEDNSYIKRISIHRNPFIPALDHRATITSEEKKKKKREPRKTVVRRDPTEIEHAQANPTKEGRRTARKRIINRFYTHVPNFRAPNRFLNRTPYTPPIPVLSIYRTPLFPFPVASWGVAENNPEAKHTRQPLKCACI